MENSYRALVCITSAPDIRLKLVAEESTLDLASENNARVYTTQNGAVAGAHRSYLDEMHEILTLAEKGGQNPNVAKLLLPAKKTVVALAG